MGANIFSQSETFKAEYCCRLHRFEDESIFDLPDSDRLSYTLIGDDTVVIQRGVYEDHKGPENSVVFYVTRECVLPADFLAKNNLFAFDKYQMNENAAEVDALLAESKKLAAEGDAKGAKKKEDEAKRKCGFFYEKCRVRVATLRGKASNGFIFGTEELIRWKPELKSYFEEHSLSDILNENVDEDGHFFFDTIADELFCYAYVPKTNPVGRGGGHRSRKKKKQKEYPLLIPGQFEKHYDTQKFGDNIHKFSPDDVVDISVKIHGSSWILSHCLRKFPIPDFPKWKSLINKVLDLTSWTKKFRFIDTYEDYDVIWSTRKVPQNPDVNPDKNRFYETDIYKPYYDLLKDYVPKGMSLYGEIFGYEVGSQKMIQPGCPGFDYKCEPGTNKLMLYRITTMNDDGETKREWEIAEVKEWTEKLLAEHEELQGRMVPIYLLYHGTLKDLYPDIDTEHHWQMNVLMRMKEDKENFCMEDYEPLCNNKVPREGLVIRKCHDELSEAFKLKCDAFFAWEKKKVDQGIVDRETAEEYGDGSNEVEESGAAEGAETSEA